MATPQPIQFATQIGISVSVPVSAELLQNLYLESTPKGAKHPWILVGTPGLTSFATAGAGPVRGMHQIGGYLYVVSGNRLYRVSDTAAVDDIGEIEGTGTVRIADNGTHLWIAADTKAYFANASGVWELPEANFVGVAYQDGFLVAAQGGGQMFWVSPVDDATDIPGLNFSSADAYPDNMVGCIQDHRELLMFKEQSCEVYYNSGAAGVPFARSQVIERGCLSGDSIAKANNMVYWLGNDMMVYRMAGYSPEPISPECIVRLIEATPSPQTATGFTYQQDGHTFYVLSFSHLTLCYDTNTGLWHQRISDGMERWRVSCHAWMDRWQKHIVGDCETGALYVLDPSAFDEAGEVLRARAVGAPLSWQGQRARVDELFIDIEAGVGRVSGQGEDPTAVLDWSEDGGVTYGAPLTRSFGKIGERTVRARWHRLGAHRLFVPRLTITDPVPRRIAGSYVRTTVLAA